MSSFKNNTGLEIQDAFEKFHKDNPDVFLHIVKQAKRAVREKKMFSVKQICGWIRWELYMETKENTLFTDSEGTKHKFKINDAYTSRYSRLLIAAYPEFEPYVEQRKLRS